MEAVPPRGGEAGSLWNLHTLSWSRKDLVYRSNFFLSFFKYYFGFYFCLFFGCATQLLGFLFPKRELNLGLSCEIAKA